ncbi:Flp family type IVb pilin [Aestuariivirga sp.]|uniref:Flp family type IVb pilin n=1 Tax=Aestuariivirga sp. TaxID=2650926 RepID=UPI00391C61EA
MSKFLAFLKNESGATAIEYGLIASAIGGVLIATLPTLRNALTANFNSLSGSIDGF